MDAPVFILLTTTPQSAEMTGMLHQGEYAVLGIEHRALCILGEHSHMLGEHSDMLGEHSTN